MASNKHVDFKKLENFVRSECYPEDISKDKGKKVNSRKSCKNFKIIDGRHLTYKGKRKVISGNGRKFLISQCHSILPYSNTHLRPLNCNNTLFLPVNEKA